MIIEETLYDYLTENMEVPVYFEASDSDEYILIERFDTSEVSRSVKTAGFTFECYSDSLINSITLETVLQSTISSFDKIENIFKVEFNNSKNFTDTEMKRYCQCSTYFITYKE